MVSIIPQAPVDVPGTLTDVKIDSYGKRLGACSSDGSLLIYNVANNTPQPLAHHKLDESQLKICWAPCQYSGVCATANSEGVIQILDVDVGPNQPPRLLYRDDRTHSSFVTCIEFTILESSLNNSDKFSVLTLTAGSMDGTVSIHSLQPDHTWTKTIIDADLSGVTSLSWAKSGPLKNRLAVCGATGMVRVWTQQLVTSDWVPEFVLGSHDDLGCAAVAGCAWRPSSDSIASMTSSLLAVCGINGCIIFWTLEVDGTVRSQKVDLGSPCEGLSWSITGAVLAVAIKGDTLRSSNPLSGSNEPSENPNLESTQMFPQRNRKPTVLIFRETSPMTSNKGEWFIASATDSQ